jgi:hypothetical protein
LLSSCIVASFVAHSRDYGGPRAAYDAHCCLFTVSWKIAIIESAAK